MHVHIANYILGNFSVMAGPIDLELSGDIACNIGLPSMGVNANVHDTL